MVLDRLNRRDTSIITATAMRLGLDSITVLRYVTGQQYPKLPMVRRIEDEFGWSVEEQVRLLPADPSARDLGYGMVLAEVMKEHYADMINDPDFPPAWLPLPTRRRRRVSPGWSHGFVATVLGIRNNAVTRYLNGERYPEVRAMLSIEKHLGWPATEQIALVPHEGYDERYADAFRTILDAKYPPPEKRT